MISLLLPLWLLLAKEPPLCQVKVQPAVTIAPARYIRSRVTVEPRDFWRVATLSLYDEDGFVVKGSQVWEQSWQLAPRTTIVEWPNIFLGPGEYLIRLTVTTPVEGRGCVATGKLIVSGDGQP